jgi:hypothetical protein
VRMRSPKTVWARASRSGHRATGAVARTGASRATGRRWRVTSIYEVGPRLAELLMVCGYGEPEILLRDQAADRPTHRKNSSVAILSISGHPAEKAHSDPRPRLLSRVVRLDHLWVRVAGSRHTVIEQRQVLIAEEVFFPINTDEHHRVTFASARLILVAHCRCGHRPVM